MIFNKYVTFLVLFCTTLATSSRKSKRLKELDAHTPYYDEFASKNLPSDLQVSTFLSKNVTKEFNYISNQNNTSITLILSACSSNIYLNMKFNNQNQSENVLEQIIKDMQMIPLKLKIGNYSLKLQTIDDSYVFIYISTESKGPEALKSDAKLQLKRQRNDRVIVKWDLSLVDPQSTSYCLVISGERNYGTLCSAQADRYGVIKPGMNYQRPVAASQTVISWMQQERDQDKYELKPNIVCTGRQTQFNLLNVMPKRRYYFNIFAINGQTNLTYLYGTKEATFDKQRSKPVSLKDGKLKFVKLKELEGKAVFKFKVGRKSGESLDVYVLPCGGAVDVQISLKKEVIEAKQMIESFGKISIPKPKTGASYYIKIFSTNGEELKRTSGIQLYVTSRSSSIMPLPDLPINSALNEYISLRTCNSVTIGWLPVSGQKVAQYCLVIKDGKLRDGFKQINQCGLENRLKKSADFSWTYCKDFKHNNETVLTQKVNHLKPGRSYIIQVTVKKPRGKTISYDLLQVQTKPKCDYRLS